MSGWSAPSSKSTRGWFPGRAPQRPLFGPQNGPRVLDFGFSGLSYIPSRAIFMSTPHNLFQTLQDFDLGNGQKGKFYSLPQLEKAGVGPVSQLPVSIRLVLESILRNCDGKRVTEQNVRALANWKPNTPRTEEIPFVVARIVLQDFTGVPLLVDLAAMRSAFARLRKN